VPDDRAADLVNAWAYVAAHSGEIDRQILENEEAYQARPLPCLEGLYHA
jgi:hypothetical protein